MTKTNNPLSRYYISRDEFVDNTDDLSVRIGHDTEAGFKEDIEGAIQMQRKLFSSGSFGWHGNQRAYFRIEDKMIPVQLNLQIVVVGSKEAP